MAGRTFEIAQIMRERPSSRLLIIGATQRTLLFRFEQEQGSLAGRRFWATPGGGLEPGESYAQAACRGRRSAGESRRFRCPMVRWCAPTNVIISFAQHIH
jgi:hypothetical protein